MRFAVMLVAVVAVLAAGGPVRASLEDAGPVAPDPSDCRVPPLPPAELVPPTPGAAASPVTPHGRVDEPLLEADQLAEDDLPKGEPADSETVAAILALQLEYAACLNAGEFARAAALFTPGERRNFLILVEDPAFSEFFASPVPLPEEMRIPSVAVRGVRVFPDGRVGALVDWGPETNFRIHERVGGQWRLGREIFIYGPRSEGEATPRR